MNTSPEPRRRCALEDCERPRGWGPYCKTHGLRNRLYGDPNYVKRAGVDYNVRGRCQHGDCGQPLQARGLCNKHYKRWQAHGDPEVVKPIEGRPPKRGVTGYDGAHKRVSRSRGPARAHKCTDCDRTATAWSYDNSDPNELIEPRNGCPYSLDADRYVPRCTSCHRKFDYAAARKKTPGDLTGVGIDVTEWREI